MVEVTSSERFPDFNLEAEIVFFLLFFSPTDKNFKIYLIVVTYIIYNQPGHTLQTYLGNNAFAQ